ncbi:hypothetical protein Bca4012_038529 [Brassica carinata]
MNQNNKALSSSFFLQCTSSLLDEILFGRFFIGLGIGVNTVLVPIQLHSSPCTCEKCRHCSIQQEGQCLKTLLSRYHNSAHSIIRT